jgi:hypothetical protein
MNPNLDPNKYQLPDLPIYNKMEPERIPIQQFVEYARKTGRIFIYNQNK